MNCRICGSQTEVIDSRPTADGDTRRRRACVNESCGTRATTFETWADAVAIPRVATLLDEIVTLANRLSIVAAETTHALGLTECARVAEALSSARRLVRLTVPEAASRAGVHVNTLYAAERGNASHKTLRKLAAAYGPEAAHLFAGLTKEPTEVPA